MFSTTQLLVFVNLALKVTSASTAVQHQSQSTITLPFVLNLNLNGSTLPEIDRARAEHAINHGRQIEEAIKSGTKQSISPQFEKRAASFGVTNTAVSYITSVGVGNPPTNYNLLIDTGSSITWIGANNAYVRTSTSVKTGKKVSVHYGSGSMSGDQYIDSVSLQSGLSIHSQSIGVANTSNGLPNQVDGILGIGPVDLTAGAVQDTPRVPTVTDNLSSQNKISSEIIGISFNPTTSLSSSSPSNGELTFGGVGQSRYTGSITYTPITKTSPSKHYWGIDQSVTYGSSNSGIISMTAGIVDTGTTLVLFASDAYNRYKTLTGATVDNKTGLLKISPSQYSKLQSLYFNIGGTRFEFTANAQIWPRQFNRQIGGTPDDIYLVVSELTQLNGKGLDFINGYTFLQRFYSVYDTTNNRVGIATTPNTYSTTN